MFSAGGHIYYFMVGKPKLLMVVVAEKYGVCVWDWLLFGIFYSMHKSEEAGHDIMS